MLGNRYWLLVTGHWLLVTGHWLLVTVYLLLDAGHWIVSAGILIQVPAFTRPIEMNEKKYAQHKIINNGG